MDEPDKPKDKVPIPGTDGWLRVTTTHGHVFYAQKKTKRSEWTMPEEIRPAVLAWEASLEPAPKKMRTEAPEDEVTTPEPSPVEADEFAHLSFEEGKVLFMDMLTSLNGTPREVNPIAPWDRELPKFVHERAYRALPTLEDRQDVFNEWCKHRLREKRARKPSASQDAFRALLRAQVASTRTTFAAFRDAFQHDPAYQAMVRDHAEAGAASLFDAWLSELKQRKLQQAEAADVDASTFDYDGVYDKMKQVERVRQQAKKEQDRERKPKYMHQFFEAAEARERDRLRAEAKMIQRERAAEGDAFRDTEAFVTSAYQAQQEAWQRAEEEERLRETRARSRSRGVAAFRHSILHDESQRRQELLAALSEPTDVQAQAAAPMSDRQRAERAAAEGLHVELNDDHQIVDQRDLLKRGLNVMTKRKDTRDAAPAPTSRAKRSHLMEEALLARVGDDSDDDEA